MTRVSHVTDPTPLCKSLMHLGQFIFATRAEACEYNFGPMQIQQIREGRPVSDFCVFEKHKRGRFFWRARARPKRTFFDPATFIIQAISGTRFLFFVFWKNSVFSANAREEQNVLANTGPQATRKNHPTQQILLFLQRVPRHENAGRWGHRPAEHNRYIPQVKDLPGLGTP